MKKYIYIAYTVILLVLLSLVGILSLNVNKSKKLIYNYDNNFKALNLENKVLSNEIIAYKFNVEQLEYINDSIIKELNASRKELKIKDKELKQLQKIKTEVTIKDSIFIKDTIFRDNFIKLDTAIHTNWYDINVGLDFPNKISLNMTYKSDLSIIASTKKEIIGTPKKCWLGRMFQTKHNVIRVDVYDSNPYSEIKESKFVIIE